MAAYRPLLSYLDVTLILCTNYCDGAAAVLFATTLRSAGLPVKLVGLAGQQVTAKHGVAFTCDLTLGEALALAKQVGCLLIPCSAAVLNQCASDPRLRELLQWAAHNEAHLIAPQPDVLTRAQMVGLDLSAMMVDVYQDLCDLLRTAQRLIAELAVPPSATRPVASSPGRLDPRQLALS